MDIGKFLQGWDHPSRYGIDYSHFTRESKHPLTDKGLYASRGEVWRHDYKYEIVSPDGLLKMGGKVRFEVEPDKIKKVWIQQLFEEIPDFPQAKRENPLQNIVPNQFAWDENKAYSVRIKYGDPYKLGGFDSNFTGNLEEIRLEMRSLQDYMWHKMNCNGNPYVNFEFQGKTWDRNFELLFSKGTGLYLRKNAHLISGCCLVNVFKSVFRLEHFTVTRQLNLDDLLRYIDDDAIYAS